MSLSRQVPLAPGAIRGLMRRSARFKAFMKHRRVQQLVKANRRRPMLAPTWRYFLAELFATGGARRYRLRETGATVVLRPGTRDTDILQEIFLGPGVYAPPPMVVERLARATPLHVLDLGGNIGLFGLYLCGRYEVEKLVSYEPDPTNTPLLQANIGSNGLASQWHLETDCISNRDGTVKFRSGLFADSLIVDAGPGIEVQCRDIFTLRGKFDLVKMDIEGSEWDVLADDRLRDFPSDVLVIEWHAAQCPFEAPRAAVVSRLREVGFEVEDVPRGEESEVAGMLWAWR